MDVTVIADSTDDGLTPVTAQLVGAAASIGGTTVLCPGGVGLLRLHLFLESPRSSL